MKYVIKPTLILLLVALFTSINNDAFTQMIQINLDQTSDSYLNPNSLTINVDMELEASDESVETFLDEQLEEAFIHFCTIGLPKDRHKRHNFVCITNYYYKYHGEAPTHNLIHHPPCCTQTSNVPNTRMSKLNRFGKMDQG